MGEEVLSEALEIKKDEEYPNYLVLEGLMTKVRKPSIKRFYRPVRVVSSKKGTLQKKREVCLAPPRFIKRVRNVSQNWNNWQKKNYINIGGDTEGGESIRLLPTSKYPEFERVVTKMKTEFQSIEADLKRWRDEGDYQEGDFTIDELKQTMSEEEATFLLVGTYDLMDAFTITVAELKINPEIALKSLDKEELKNKARAHLADIIRSINGIIYEDYDKIRKGLMGEYVPNLNVMKRNIKNVRDLCKAWDVSEIFNPVLDTMENLAQATIHDRELTKEELEPIAKTMAESIGAKYNGDPYAILDKVDMLKEGYTDRDLAFLRSI